MAIRLDLAGERIPTPHRGSSSQWSVPPGPTFCVLITAISIVLAGLIGCSQSPTNSVSEHALEQLAVVPRPPVDGSYRREAFGSAWADTDHNSCNQRDDALFASVDKLRPFTVHRQHGCDHDMVSGTWLDPYSAQTVTFSNLKAPEQARAIPIDHIVALGVSWRYGAKDWTSQRRLEFATDLNNLQPTSTRTNSIKSDHDAAAWRPPKGQQCAYASRYVTIKQTYALAVDTSEKRALSEMLQAC